MITPFRIVAAAGVLLVTGLFTTLGHAQSANWQVLREDPQIHAGLTVIAVGRHIQGICGDIRPRMVRAWTFAEGLVARAEDLGVGRADVDAFIDNRAEQERYTAIMIEWFAARGVDTGDEAAICRVGRDEITAGTPIGRLLRSR
ncbi:DUF5333 domain-containing protein [Jannaschia sp. CCS1]|uniref:DUF5333 domain-containing protein n=1 Tax=Jannaschia sp. (strain CCS1) TaxID=290400 RepID=UPI000053B2CF|nr:DUF5333 domain-containing protein [Jannaschia sp. CCS1]ABD54099.1 hypothetical protein Jann_1182 [Jannaschia sp. CCS1]